MPNPQGAHPQMVNVRDRSAVARYDMGHDERELIMAFQAVSLSVLERLPDIDTGHWDGDTRIVYRRGRLEFRLAGLESPQSSARFEVVRDGVVYKANRFVPPSFVPEDIMRLGPKVDMFGTDGYAPQCFAREGVYGRQSIAVGYGARCVFAWRNDDNMPRATNFFPFVPPKFRMSFACLAARYGLKIITQAESFLASPAGLGIWGTRIRKGE